jgi:hypothetical protein
MNLILFCLEEHYRLAEGVSEDKASLIFNNAAHKVIKDAFKHTRCISACEFTSFLHIRVEVIVFLL